MDTLASINQRMGRQAESHFDELPSPPSQEEGKLLVFTGDGKGVQLEQRLNQSTVENAEEWFEGYLPLERIREFAEIYFEDHDYDTDED